MLRFLIIACTVSAIYAAECGQPAIAPEEMSVNIVGGVEAKPNSWPWMTEVIKNGWHYCGGTLIDDQWVVSAAHCFDDHLTTSATHEFSVGGHKSANYGGKSELKRQTFYARAIILHEKYEKDGKGYDIALIKLDGTVRYNDYVSPACLAETRPADGTKAYVTGWGDLEYEGSSPSALHQVAVPIVSQRDCERVYGRSRIDETMICAGLEEGGKDSCQGDSGGPMVVKVKTGLNKYEWTLVGVVSWGSGCAKPEYYGVYSDVDNLSTWIKDTMYRYKDY